MSAGQNSLWELTAKVTSPPDSYARA